jgi:hypothetical protein
MLASMAMPTNRASLAALLLAALSSSCATYKIAIEPPAMRADARTEAERPPAAATPLRLVDRRAHRVDAVAERDLYVRDIGR